MKTIFPLIAVTLLCHIVSAQVVVTRINPQFANPLNQTASAPPQIPDPWRIIDGVTMKVDGTWLALSGLVIQVHNTTCFRMRGRINGEYSDSDYFVTNYPYALADNDSIPKGNTVVLVKMRPELVTYSTVGGSVRTLHLFDYGQPTSEPHIVLTPEQIAANAAHTKEHLQAAEKAKFEHYKKLATDGDAAAQYEMGKDYRDGVCVETNLNLARFYFKLSAEQNHSAASNALAHFPEK